MISLPVRVSLFLLSLLLIAPRIASTPTAASSTTRAHTVALTEGLLPLPKGCGGGLPPGASVPVCCISGYVILNGQPIEGARVTIINMSDDNKRLTVVTTRDSASAAPSFRVSLSGAPLDMQPGQPIRIVAEFSGKSQSIQYITQSGGQQVDIVIPQSATDSYMFERKFSAQTEPRSFAMYRGDIARDGVGNLYVVDADNSRIQVFNRNETYLFSWGSFGHEPGRMFSPTGIAIDHQLNVYVTDMGRNAVHKFTTGGAWLATWELASPTQEGLATDVATDNAGNVYVTLEGRGATGATQVRKFSSNGQALAAWGLPGSTGESLQNPWGVWVGADGLVYVADTGNNRIAIFSADGDFQGELGVGYLNTPKRVSVAPDGRIFVADSGNDRVAVFLSTGGPPEVWGARGAEAGLFHDPGGIAIAEDAVYIVDTDNQRIQVFNTAGTYLRQWGSAGDALKKLFGPEKTISDAGNNLYVVDARRDRVRKYDPNGEFLREFGRFEFGNGQLYEPQDIALDSAGNIYIADMLNQLIQVFYPDGTYWRQWKGPGSAAGEKFYPVGIAIDPEDNVYVVEHEFQQQGNNRLHKFDTMGNLQWTRGGSGAGNNPGEFDDPQDVAVDQSGNIYAADTNNCRVQKFNRAGVFLTMWGQCDAGNPALFQVASVAVDSGNIVHVIYSGNTRVERFTAEGLSLGTWGQQGPNPDQLGAPPGIEVGLDGRVYIATRAGQTVQVFRPTTYRKPIATIVAATPQVVTVGQPVALRGMGASSIIGMPPVSYEWFLNNATVPFATIAEPVLNTNGFAPGIYTVSLRVRTGGEVSEPQTILIEVLQDRSAQPRNWTFLLYLAGDNPDIDAFLNEKTPLGTLNRLNFSSGPANVTVVALYDGPSMGDTTRWIFSPGKKVFTETLEANTGDPQTLIDFVREGKQQAPADAYYLAIADHGNALDGIAWDRTSASDNSERLTNQELAYALTTITDGGQRPIDILHLDACLMGLLETAYQVRGLARYLIVSENLAWSAFAYETYRNKTQESNSPPDLAKAIARAYGEIVFRSGEHYTISVLDMSKLDRVAVQADTLAKALLQLVVTQPERRAVLGNVREQVQKFDSNGDIALTNIDEYVDLDHLAEVIARAIDDPQAQAAAQQLRTEIGAFVLYEEHRSNVYGGLFVDLDHARGVGIFYPPRGGDRTYQTYRGDLDFATQTNWDEFLQAQLSPLQLAAEPAPPLKPVAPLPLRQFVYLPMISR